MEYGVNITSRAVRQLQTIIKRHNLSDCIPPIEKARYYWNIGHEKTVGTGIYQRPKEPTVDFPREPALKKAKSVLLDEKRLATVF